MTRRTVDLVIRARDEARSALTAINQTLDKFVSTQQKVQSESAGTDSRLAALGAAFKELQGAIGDVSASARVTGELRKIGGEIKRIESAIESTTAEFDQYNAKLRETKNQTERLVASQGQVAARLDRQKAAVAQAATAQQRLTAATKAAAAAQDRYAARQQKISAELDRLRTKVGQQTARFIQLRSAVGNTEEPTKRLVQSFNSAGAALSKTRARIADLIETQRLIATESERAARSVERANTVYGSQAASIDKATRALNKLQQEYQEVSVAADASTKEQARLTAVTERTGATLEQQRARLSQVRGEYEATQATLRQTGGALAQLDSVTRSTLLKSLRQQVDRLRASRQAYQELRSEAARLGQAVQSAAEPSRALVQAFQQTKTAAAAAKQELNQQAVVLTKMNEILRESGGDVDVLSARLREFAGQVERAEAGFQGLSAASARTAQAIRAAEQAQRQAAAGANATAGAVNNLAAAQRRAAGSTGLFADAIRRFYGESRTALSFTQRLRGEVLSLIAAYAGFFAAIQGVRNVVSAFQQLEAAQSRLRVVFDGDEVAVGREIEFIRGEARRLGIEFGALAQEYTKFAVATKGTNLEGENTRLIFTKVAEAARVNKLSLDQIRGTFVALTQIVSKGTVSMEELRQQLGDRLPGAIQIMADAAGVGTAELIKMIENGQLSSDVLVDFAKELDKRFGKQLPAALKSTSAEIGRFQNTLFETFLRIGQGGAIEGFTNLLKDFNKTLTDPKTLSFLDRLGAGLGKVFEAVGALVRNWDLLIIAISTFIGFRLAPFVFAIAASFGRLRGAVLSGVAGFAALRAGTAGAAGAMTGFAAATNLARAALIRLLSASGIGILVALIGTAIGEWLTRTNAATEALTIHEKAVNRVREAYRETGGEIDKIREKLGEVAKIELRGNIAQFKTAIEAAGEELNGLNEFGAAGINAPINDLIRDFNDGKLTLEEFAAGLRKFQIDLAKYSDRVGGNIKVSDEWVASLLEAATKQDELRQKLAESEKALTVLEGTTEEAEKAVKDFADTTEAAGNTVETEAKRVGKLGDAMNELRAFIPKVAAEYKKLEKIASLDAALVNTLKLVKTWGELKEAVTAYGAARDSIREKELTDIVPGAAVSGSLVDRIINAESGGRADAKNPLSSATGLGQFIESTWLNLFRKYLPERASSLTRQQILALRTDAELSRKFVGIYVKELVQSLQGAGIQPTDANVYAAYFLGPGTANKVLSRPDDTPLGDVLPPSYFRANPALRGQTVGQFRDSFARKVGASRDEISINERLNEIERERAETAAEAAEKAAKERADQQAATDKRIKDTEFEINNQNLKNAGKEKEAFIEAEIRAAKLENKNLTAEEEAQIRKLAAAKFDALNADKAKNAELEKAKAAEAEINKLVSLRTNLQSLLDQQLASGASGEAIQQTRDALTGVNEQLEEAIANSLKMLEALKSQDPAIQAIIARMKELQISSGQTATFMGISFDQVAQAFQGAFVNAVDKFAQAIANGEKATVALKDAFLQFASDFLRSIAQMILRQLALNAAKAIGKAFGFGVAHSGGVIGQRGVARYVSPAAFAVAPRYHSGGIAGLRPGEVPTILQRGEEVLTRNDPRHIFNGGGQQQQGGQGGPLGVKVVNAIDGPSFLDEALRSKGGTQTFINFVQSNRSAIRGALGA